MNTTWSCRGAAALLVIALSACGGGSGGDNDSPPPAGSSDLAVTVSAPPLPVASGTATSFTAVVTNAGSAAANNVMLTSALSGMVSGGVASCAASGGAVCPITLGASMTVSTFPAGGTLTFGANATAATGATGAIGLTFTATASNDGVAGNNAATATGSAYSANVSVIASAPVMAVPAGNNAVFTLVVANAGPDAARDAVVTASPGAGLTLGTVTCVAAGSATCPATLGATLTVAMLPSGGQLTLTVPAMVTAGTNGPVVLDVAVASAGDPVVADNTARASGSAYSANVAVSITGDTFVAAGTPATFVGTVSNAGPAAAANVIVATTLSSGYAAGTITCAASGGAVCPASISATTTVPTLPVGGTLTLTIPVVTTAAQRGAIVGQLALTSAGDPTPANNTSTATTTARDARSGDYVLHAVNGFTYTLSIDVDAATYAIGGNGFSASGAAAYDAATQWFVIAGNSRFRTSEDVVFGGFDFGGGVIPFFAARRFITDVTQLNDDFISLRRFIPVAGANDSFIGAIRLSGGIYAQCNDNILYSIANCPTASLGLYPITWNGTNFLATVAPGSAFSFRVALSGNKRIVLRASGNTTFGWTFNIGLPAGPFDAGTLQGITSAGARETVTLGATYAAVRIAGDGTTVGDSATLGSVAAIPGLRFGQRSSDNANTFLISSAPFAVVVGARGQPLAGYIEILGP